MPWLDVYCPAEHDEVVYRLWVNRVITSDNILNADCEILKTKDVLILANDRGMSEGMAVERECAQDMGLIYFYLKGVDYQTVDEGVTALREYIMNALLTDKERLAVAHDGEMVAVDDPWSCMK